MSEEEMKQREARFQKAINFCLKWIDKRNFSIVNCEPVVKPAMSDNGFGPMAWGVSVPTLKAAYLAGIVGHWNIGKLTKDEAKAIYRRYYWERYGWGELDWPVCLCCLDASINHSGFAWILQMALVDCGCKIAIDGKFGPKTFAALKTREPARLAAKIISYDKAYCEQQAAQDTSITHLNAMAKEAGVELEDVEIDPE
jgi:lysozyme family protein